MKSKILLALSCLLILTSCDFNDDSVTTPEEDIIITVQWHLTDVTGGIAGVSEQFNLGVIVWTFNDLDKILTVVNDNDDDSVEDFLDSGTYTYSILEESDSSYLVISSTEYGELLFPSASTLIIDSNEFSSSSGTDGFTYNFQRVLVQDN